MTNFFGFEKEDFTSIVDVGAAVFQLMSDIAFYDGSDDASGIHSIDRDNVGRNKVVSERRKQAIQEYYETEEEDDEGRNPKVDSRDGFGEVEHFSTWATRDTYDDSMNTYETSDVPLLPAHKNLSTRNVYFGKTKLKYEMSEDAEMPKQDKALTKSALRASLKLQRENGAMETQTKTDDEEKKADSDATNESRDASDMHETHETTSLRSEPAAKSSKPTEKSETNFSLTKQVNPKLVVGKPSGSSHHRRTILGDEAGSSRHSRTILGDEAGSSHHSRTIVGDGVGSSHHRRTVVGDGTNSIMSMPTTKNESKISKRLLMKRAKAKIAKYNAEQQHFKVVLPETSWQATKTQDCVRNPPEENESGESSLPTKTSREQPPSTQRTPSPINELSLKLENGLSAQSPPKSVSRPASAESPPPTIVISSRKVKTNGAVPEIVKSKSRDSCRGIVSERAALWQQRQSKTNDYKSKKKVTGRADPPDQDVMDYDEYVKNFQSLHKRNGNVFHHKQ